MTGKSLHIVAVFSTFLLASGCSDGTGPTDDSQVAIRFGVRDVAGLSQVHASAPGTLSGATTQGITLSDGMNTLEITEVKLTLEDIDLEGQSGSPNIEGPILVRLSLTGDRLTNPLTTEVPPGTYSLISFDISVPDGGDPEEVAYLAQNPDMADVSIRVNGMYNGETFSFALDLRGDQEITIAPPMVVTESSVGLEVVVWFDLDSWFRRPDGSLMNPSAICSPDDDSDPPGCSPTDRTLVEGNIELSVESESDT